MNAHIGDSEKTCAELLGHGNAHEVDCPVGPLSIQRHSHISEPWCRMAQSCGCLARREVVVPEFYDHKKEESAFLDVLFMGHPDFPYFLGDVIIINPAAKRYQPGAAKVPGYAAIRAADEKHRRYPTKRGVGMVPLVQEAYGRLGEEAEDTLTRLAVAHSRKSRRKGLPQATR